MTFGSTFGRTFSPTFQPSSQAAAVAGGGWWDLNGTITSCVAAYQPKGAASYAASKVNLTGNTDYDGTSSSTPPEWDTSTGWAFDLTKSTRIITGVAGVNTGWSVIIRYSNSEADGLRYVCGAYYGMGGIYGDHGLVPSRYSKVYYGGSPKSPGLMSGILAIAGTIGYRNGTEDLDPVDVKHTGTVVYCIGSSSNSGTYLSGYTGKVQAFALYNSVLTSTQIGNLTTAMAAL